MSRARPSSPIPGPSDAEPPPRLAVFDVDDTLYRANTLYYFLERHFARWSARKWIVFRTARTLPGKAAWVLINKAARRDVLRQTAFRSLRGEREQEVCEAAAYVAEELPRSVLSLPTGLLRSAKADGYHVLVVSGTASPIAQAVARSLDAATAEKMWRGHLGGRADWRYELWAVLMFQARLETAGIDARPAVRGASLAGPQPPLHPRSVERSSRL